MTVSGWGKSSKVANIDGIRSELVEHMRKIKPAVIRFPGGCFADSYDWRDGVGPADKRPRRTNFWEGVEAANAPANHRYDPNQFGTDEFVHFCRLTGGQPYLAANVRSLPAEEFYRWVEYCNSPAGFDYVGGDARCGRIHRSRSTSVIGAWETNRGAVAETFCRRSMPWSFGDTQRGCRVMASHFR